MIRIGYNHKIQAQNLLFIDIHMSARFKLEDWNAQAQLGSGNFSSSSLPLTRLFHILYDTLRPSVSELGQGPLIENCNQRLLGLVQDRGFKAFMTLATFHWKLLTRFTKPEKPRALIMEKKLGILTRLFHIPYHTLRPSVSELVAGAVFWPFWPCRPFWLLSIGKQRSLEGIWFMNGVIMA